MQVMRTFFDVVTALDPKAAEYDDGVKAPICRPKPMSEMLESSGLRDVEVRRTDIPAAFDSFDDYWSPFLGGTGSAPKYCASLGDEAREHLKSEIKRRLPIGPDGEILSAIRAWAGTGAALALRMAQLRLILLKNVRRRRPRGGRSEGPGTGELGIKRQVSPQPR